MKRIFVYGDSNVWGDNFSGPRIPYHARWVNRLRRSLGKDYSVIANAVPGRIAGEYRDDKPAKNGKSAFKAALRKVEPVDTVLVALGTNDLQVKFKQSADDIVKNLLWYKDVCGSKNVIYLLPSNFETGDNSGPEFTEKSLRVRHDLLNLKETLGNYTVVENVELSDGLHFSSQGHKTVAETMLAAVKAGR